MSLDQSKLESALREHFKQPYTEFVAPANNLARIYAAYAGDAQSCGGGAPVPGAIEAARALLRVTLAATLATARDPGTYAQNISVALSAFWLLPPIGFVGVPPGVVTLAAPPLLYASVLAALAAGAAAGGAMTPDRAAQLWAAAFHNWTKTVVVAHGPPISCAGPIT